MKDFWIYFIPLLYLPNLGFGLSTKSGVLEISDFLIVPLFLFLFIKPNATTGTWAGKIEKLGLAFVIWCLIGVLSIPLFYDYSNAKAPLLFSLLKLAKFTLYTYTGILICKHLNTPERRDKLNWSILFSQAITAFSLIILTQVGIFSQTDSISGYKTTNQVSVLLSIFAIYTSALYVKGYGSQKWRTAAVVSLLISFVGTSFSDGRGGWLAALAGLLYIAFNNKIKFKYVVAFTGLAATIYATYELNPEFKRVVDKTVNPDKLYLKAFKGKIGVAGVDDGGRISTWENEFSKWPQAPIVGTGFFHRGGKTSLWATGSHNFWLQMLLETGLVGFLILLSIMTRFWRQAGAQKPLLASNFAFRASLITAGLGGLSGEYFYGGVCLLSLLLVYANLGSQLSSESS